MTTTSIAPRLLAAALLAAALPAAARADQRTGPADAPRASWYARYVEARQGPEQEDRISRTFRVGRDGALDLQNLSGEVRVTGGSGDEIRIEAVKRVRARGGQDPADLLEALRVDISQIGSRIEVRTQYPRTRGNVSASVDYTISVPAGAAVAVKTVSGDLVVERVAGEVRAETVSGNVDVTGTPNLAIAKSVSGDVTARDIGAESSLELGTVSGNLRASRLKVRALDAGSVSGDLELEDIAVERLEAKSVSGNVVFSGGLARGGRYELTSHSGNVRLRLAGDTGFELEASSFSGSIRSDLPITMRPDGDGRGARNRNVRGSYGDASAVLAVRSFSGNVVIARQ